MSNIDWDNNNPSLQADSFATSLPEVNVRPLLRLVYLWMGLGLLLTAVVSAVVTNAISNDFELLVTFYNLRWPLMIGQLAIVFGLVMTIRKLSPGMALALFFVYAGTLGLTLGVLFYTLIAMEQGGAIASAFFSTAGLFGAMTVVGFTTNVDLSKYSSYFMMALIGLVIAMVVNMFMQSDAMSYMISVAGVLIFTALTAWDTQKIKNLAALPEYRQHSDDMKKLAVMGALTLYLDFINLFIFLLRLFSGGRR